VELLAFPIAIAVTGLIVGALARVAIPGPDPMSIWATIGLGALGSLLGGAVGWLLFGSDMWAFPFLVGGATLLLGLHRRFVQRRPLFGPGARRSAR
jgi:uncharacterized membrane protein YeaQ/YmgE (transglycosylase-associated protein family)